MSIERTPYPFPQFKRLTSTRILYVFFTSIAEAIANAPAEQEKLINTLLANPVIFTTPSTSPMSSVVRSPRAWITTAVQLAALSPYLRAHIRRFGAYATDDLTHQPDPFDPALPAVDLTTLDIAA